MDCADLLGERPLSGVGERVAAQSVAGQPRAESGWRRGHARILSMLSRLPTEPCPKFGHVHLQASQQPLASVRPTCQTSAAYAQIPLGHKRFRDMRGRGGVPPSVRPVIRPCVRAPPNNKGPALGMSRPPGRSGQHRSVETLVASREGCYGARALCRVRGRPHRAHRWPNDDPVWAVEAC